jgi:hypothetical protein
MHAIPKYILFHLTSSYRWILSIMLILPKIDPLAFSQKRLFCRRRYRSAVTTLFLNKNAFNANLEPCFFTSILKKTPAWNIHFRPIVPHGTIAMNLPDSKLVKFQEL